MTVIYSNKFPKKVYCPLRVNLSTNIIEQTLTELLEISVVYSIYLFIGNIWELKLETLKKETSKYFLPFN